MAVKPANAFGWISTRRWRATALLLTFGVVVIALLVVFAIELSNSQANSKASVESRVQERAVLAGDLVDSLFQSVEQAVPADSGVFGGRTVSQAALDKQRGTNAYLAVLGPHGNLIASTTGFTSQDRQATSGAVKLVEHGDPYGLGNLSGSGKSAVIEFAIGLRTPYGRRIVAEGATPAAVTDLIGGELSHIPGAAGSHNLIVDANDTVIASNLKSRPTGYQIVSRDARAALGHSSGERDGRYYDQLPLANSTWRIVLNAPEATLFASVSGLNHWLPWLVLIAFGLMAAVALVLGWRVLHSAERNVAVANSRLEAVNRELEASNLELQRRAAELSRSNAELDQFASIASHDLQEPLRKVRTFTEQIATTESERLSERGADYLARANRAAERMQGLIQDLLQFSRVTTNPRPFVAVDLSQVVADVLDDLSVEIEHAGGVVSVGELPTIQADPLQMRQLMLNLISNALKFRREDAPPEVRVDGNVADGFVQITVADNGIGFEPQYSTRIFRVFERLNGRTEYPGTGIGLALCHKIVSRHHGQIEAEGRPGEGAKLTVVLPIDQPVEQSEPILDDRPEPAAKEQARAIR
jgi:signal transduction histidine kinase